MKRILLLTSLLTLYVIAPFAQRTLTIDECRDLALNDNKQAQISNELVAAATDLRKSAVANFFPKLSANGAYLWNEKNLQLLPNELTTSLGTFNAASQTFITTGGTNEPLLGSMYSSLHEATEFDIHNVFVGQVGVIQPIYVGGRITQGYKMAQSAEKIAKMKSAKDQGDIVVKVNEAYWRVVSVQEKLKLATQYVNLLKKLEENVQNAIEEGVATKTDLLNVKVKLNEGEMKKAQAEDGLALSKMALCQLCGLPLEEDIQLDASGLESFVVINEDDTANVSAAYKRTEVQLLEEGEKMAKSAAALASASLQPNIVAGANYIVSNPHLLDGFQNKFDGGFNVSVVVNIPIAHVDAIYRYKSAKHAANVAKLKLEETVEMIQLQITQSTQKVKESNKKLKRAQTNLEHAEETLKMAQEAYEEGVVTATDLMMAETGWQQAYSERIDAAIELRNNELTLLKNIGELDVKTE